VGLACRLCPLAEDKTEKNCLNQHISFVAFLKLDVKSAEQKEKSIMCPVCISTAALMVAGATSTGGLSAFVTKRLLTKGRAKNNQPNSNQKQGKPA
jgi:hypothetical protein